MKILLIHLSDFHFSKANSSFSERQFSELVASLGNTDDCDGIGILFTGDVAQSGQKDEYVKADSFFKGMLREFKARTDKTPELFVVPGNHDLFSPQEISNEEFRTITESQAYGTEKETVDSQLNRMRSFFEWARGYKIDFSASRVVSRNWFVCDSHRDARIRVTMINSVPLSFVGRSDKGYHSLSVDEIASIRCDENNDYHLVMMHHSPEWFKEECKRPLMEAINSTADALAVGHEHVDGVYETEDNENRPLFILEGGTADFTEWESLTFSRILIDMDQYPYCIEEKTYEWDRCSQYFILAAPDKEFLCYPKRGAIVPHNAFMKQMDSADNSLLSNASLSDYFVFPPLVSSADLKTGQTSRLDAFDAFFKAIKDERIICIRGKSSSGKTALTKMLYLQSVMKGYVPLFLSCDRAHPSLTKMLDSLIEEQYGSGEKVEHQFKSLYGRRILIIDDFDKLKKGSRGADSYLQELLRIVDKVVYTTGESEVTDVVESVKRQLELEESICEYSLHDFVRSKREDLVRKICGIESVTNAIRDRLVVVVNQSAASHRGLFPLTPDFIINYSIYMLSNKDALSSNDVVPLAKLYEDNIKRAVEKALRSAGGGRSARLAQATMLLLASIAYEMHEKKRASLSMVRIAQIVTEYSENYGVNIDVDLFVTAVKTADIACFDDNGDLRFRSVNQLAFFIARRINRDLQNGRSGSDLEYLLDNICFDINERVLLFLAYLRENSELPSKLCERIEETLGGIRTLDLADQALSLFAHDSSFELGMVDKTASERRRRASDAAEESLAQQEVFEYADVYDYKEADRAKPVYRLIRAFKYLEMLGRAYVVQYAYTEIAEKELIREALFQGASKIVSETLGRLNNRFDATVQRLWRDYQEYAKEVEDARPVSREEIAKFIQGFAFVFAISIYDSIAYNCAEADTLTMLEKYDDDDIHALVLKTCMRENALSSTEFIEALCKTAVSCKQNSVERRFLMLIANKHITNHPDMKSSDLDRIAQVVFGDISSKKDALIAKARKLHSDET